MAGSIVATTYAGKGRGIIRVDCALTCASGAISAQPIGSFYGRLVAVLADPVAGAGATMTSTADILLTDAVTGAPILSDLSFGAAAFNYRPTQAVVDAAGAAITPATTANDVNRDIFVAGKLNLAIANATTTDTGLLSFIFEEA
ncbi:MAG: hypothetical protein ACREMY_32765 [bacterium]